jgi:cytosolic carboxypeptidase protein 2/3
LEGCHSITIQDYIVSSTFTDQCVYERIYPNSLEQRYRESYFLTEIYNIKKNTVTNEEDSAEVRIITNTMKTLSNAKVTSYYTLLGSTDKTLIFESRFESGNLCLAGKVSDEEYNLLLQNDINTKGYTQWFFFRTTNTFANTKIKFNIINFLKSDSLFNQGMRILVYSAELNTKEGVGWHRDGMDVKYFANGIKRSEASAKSLYTLSFTYEYKFTGDTVYFAYSFPYTYTDLHEFLNAIEMDESKEAICKRNTLCRTLAGNKCEYLTITSRTCSSKKKGVVLSARTHPGETVGSWMMQGAIELLTDMKDALAERLRKHFVFKIIPMINPDGVINGNYRCSLAGCDLNRRWKSPQKFVHPCIYHAKKLIRQFHSERGLVFFCDMHGHSRKKNVFMYGCVDQQEPESTRIFPYMLSNICPFFSYDSCRFGVQKSKENTARISLWRELDIPSVYTIEASFCGCDNGQYSNLHFSTDHLKKLGRDMCIALLPYCQIEDIPLEVHEESKQGTNESNLSRKMLVEVLSKDKVISQLKEKIQYEKKIHGNEESGSDDSPSDGELEADVIDTILPSSKPVTKKTNPKIKTYLQSIFSLGSSKMQPHSKPANSCLAKPPEEKTVETKDDKQLISEVIEPITIKNDKYRDAFTQTEMVDFQKAKCMLSKYYMANRKNVKTSMRGDIKRRMAGDSVGPREKISYQNSRVLPIFKSKPINRN